MRRKRLVIGMFGMIMLASLFIGIPARADSQRIICESPEGRTQRCPTRLHGEVMMLRQLSSAPCIEGRSWGYKRGEIWVHAGCRAEFEVHTRKPGKPGKPGKPQGQHATQITCESAGGRTRRCPADTRGGVTLKQRISSAPCIEEHSWGYDRRGIWVRGGCRGVFEVGTLQRPPVGGMQGANRITCESRNGKRNRCRADVTGHVELLRELRGSACIEGRTWGYNKRGIWVDQGCRGVFRLVRSGGDSHGDRPHDGDSSGRYLTCQSPEGRFQRCRIPQGSKVRLNRQLSQTRCVEDRTWGRDKDSVWVDNGCRAEFEIRRRR